MKKITTILFLASLMVLIFSCKTDNDENKNFYSQEYRDGLWANQALADTLEFTSFSTVIRRGAYYNEIYTYWINDETLFLSNRGGWETSHPIRKAENNKVVIDNMYISIGFYDNSGTFLKISKN